MNKTLYRDPVNGKIGGVCAGIADYFGFEIWLVRILTVTLFLMGFSFFIIIAYIAAVLIIDKMPPEEIKKTMQSHEHQIKTKPWQQGKSANQLLADAEADTKKMEQQLAKIEAYVTSSKFELNQKFKNL